VVTASIETTEVSTAIVMDGAVVPCGVAVILETS
jgi:hypothetical protein